MTTFDASDMRTFIESLGTTIVIKDIDQQHEHHFVDETRKEVEGGGLNCLVTRYAPLVAMMDRCEKLQEPVQRCIVDTIIQALRGIDEMLINNNDDVKSLTEEEFKEYQQIVACVLFMAYKCLEEFNFCSSVQNNNASVYSKAAKGRRGGRSTTTVAPTGKGPFGFWTKYRDRLLDVLFAVIKRDLYPFWERIKKPNGKTFYGLIVQGLVATVKYGAKDICRDNFASQTVVSMFSHLIVAHNFEDDITMYLMQNILDSEDVSRAITKVIIGLRNVHSRLGVVRKSMQAAFELINRPENRDKWDKGFTSYLLDIGTMFPEEIMEHSLPYVISLMEADSVAMRNTVLSIIVEVIIHNAGSGEVDKNKDDCPGGPVGEKARELQKHLLEYLETYMRDSNAAVRTKAVAAVTSLINERGIKLDDLVPLIYEAGERILDVSASVRKSSFGVFAAIILCDPLLAKQRPEEFRTKSLATRRDLVAIRTKDIDDVPVRLRIVVKEFTEQLQLTNMGLTLDSVPQPKELLEPEEALEHIKSLLEKGMYWEACECFYKSIKYFDDIEVFRIFDVHTFEVYKSFFMKELGLNQAENVQEEIPDTFETDMLETEACKELRAFLTHMHTLEALSEFLYTKVIRIVLQLFRYGVSSDQAEVMGYLATLSENKYPLPPEVPLEILDCISRVDKSAVSQIVNPFSIIFLNGPDCQTPLGFVKTLVGLMINLGEDRRNHMNLLIQEMVRSKTLHIPCLKILWDIVVLGIPDCGEVEAKTALYILGICAKADRNSIQSLFDQIIEVGLGPRGCQDMEFAATALAAIFETLRKKNEELSHKKLPADHPLFARLYQVIRYALAPETTDQANEYFSKVADLGVSLIYDCCLNPAKVISPIINGSFKWIFAPAEGVDEQNDITQFEMSEKLMFKFLSLAGAITGSHASYHSKWVLDEVKRRKTLTALEDSAAMKAVKMRLRTSVVEIHRRKSMGHGKIAYTKSIDDQLLKADEEELDAVVGQVGFDKETELIRNYMDKLLEDGTFRFYWQNIIFICRRYKTLKSLKVRLAAIRLLVKLMLVGQKALTGLMEIYIGLWKDVKSTEENVELVLSAILLNDCYPNQMNLVNGIVIQGLKSELAEVRQATLDFVTYLTVTDVLKLREILPDTICRLADEVNDIREVTKLFLKECHEKDTMLHSAIPDMIIRLSSSEEVSEEQFQEIMKNLLEPIKKVTEVVGIGTKLLERFAGGKLKRGREAQSNALCLSLLNYNDKLFKVVRENLQQYERYLDDSMIYECFLDILKSAKENLKPEAKEKFEAYEEKLQDARKNASELRRMDTASRDPNASSDEEKKASSTSSSSDESESEPESGSPAAARRSGSESEPGSQAARRKSGSESEPGSPAARRKSGPKSEPGFPAATRESGSESEPGSPATASESGSESESD